MVKFIFSNIIGSFVFDENHKLVTNRLFKNISEYNNRTEIEQKILQEYEDIKKPKGSDLTKILLFFKNGKYFPQLYSKNLEITKKSIRDSVNTDSLIIQTINSIEELDKTISMLTNRLREWYSLYNPEISNKLENNEKFVITIINKSKKQLLKALNLDENECLGAELKEKDLAAILLLGAQLNNIFKLKKHFETYIKELLKETCPNFSTVAGTAIAAKLIGHSGSIKRLVIMPSSTIQILGAEKALFRHLRNKKKNLPPKYGIIKQHQLIQLAKPNMHGKIARALADKLSIAVRIDYFKGHYLGDKLKKELITKFKIDY